MLSKLLAFSHSLDPLPSVANGRFPEPANCIHNKARDWHITNPEPHR